MSVPNARERGKHERRNVVRLNSAIFLHRSDAGLEKSGVMHASFTRNLSLGFKAPALGSTRIATVTQYYFENLNTLIALVCRPSRHMVA